MGRCVTIEIPDVCWNLNDVIRECKNGWVTYYAHKKYWESLIYSICQEREIDQFTKPIKVSIQIVYPQKRRRDMDNILFKFVLDGLVQAQVLIDDDMRYVKELEVLEPFIQPGVRKTIVTIKELA